jgi:X-Pro dipeptidyl-peptidase
MFGQRLHLRRSRVAAAVLVAALLGAVAVPAVARTSAPASAAAMRAAAAYSYSYEKVRVPMRDGTEISAEVWRPVAPTPPPGEAPQKFPAVLHFTPYHALQVLNTPSITNPATLPDADASFLVPRGYAYVFADLRGTWNSGGCWNYGGADERKDGYDLVEYFGTRDWSNGKVAMQGVSYPGTTPNATAVEQPPHLATIVPMSAISRWWGYAYQQGARSLYSGESADIDPPSDTPGDFMTEYSAPGPDAPLHPDQTAQRWSPLCGQAQKAYEGYNANPDYTEFWTQRDYLRDAAKVQVPVLVTHGQLDFNVKTWEGTAWFEALPTEKVLVIGQWAHAHPRGKYTPGSVFKGDSWDKLLLRWYERWLYGVDNKVEEEPAVRVQTNDNRWHVREQWASDTIQSLPLTGGTFTYFDDGALTESEMLRGQGAGTRYTRVSLPNTAGIHFAGRPVLNLVASSDMPTTNFSAVLVDVGPSDTKVVSRAFMNARYRDGTGMGKDLVAGQKATFGLEFIDKDYVVAANRHLELLISSSSTTWVVPSPMRANNTLYLNESTLDLPVLP